MSNPLTDTEDAEQTVHFSTVWRSLAVLSFGMLTFTTAGIFTWGLWVTMSLNTHEKMLAVLQERSSNGKGILQSVNVNEAKDAASLTQGKDSAKTWLTTKDVAQREGITERTVLNYIEHGMIEPEPRKNGKSWEIAEHFRIVPCDAKNCGEVPQQP